MPSLFHEYVRALHSFFPNASPDEEPISSTSSNANGALNSCLSFKAGQWIRIISKDPSGWWDGEMEIGDDKAEGTFASSTKDGRMRKREQKKKKSGNNSHRLSRRGSRLWDGSAPMFEEGQILRGWFPSNYVGRTIWRRGVNGIEEEDEEEEGGQEEEQDGHGTQVGSKRRRSREEPRQDHQDDTKFQLRTQTSAESLKGKGRATLDFPEVDEEGDEEQHDSDISWSSSNNNTKRRITTRIPSFSSQGSGSSSSSKATSTLKKRSIRRAVSPADPKRDEEELRLFGGSIPRSSTSSHGAGTRTSPAGSHGSGTRLSSVAVKVQPLNIMERRKEKERLRQMSGDSESGSIRNASIKSINTDDSHQRPSISRIATHAGHSKRRSHSLPASPRSHTPSQRYHLAEPSEVEADEADAPPHSARPILGVSPFAASHLSPLLLTPVNQALSVLRAACVSTPPRASHFQLAASSLITAVRSCLEKTGCLTKEMVTKTVKKRYELELEKLQQDHWSDGYIDKEALAQEGEKLKVQRQTVLASCAKLWNSARKAASLSSTTIIPPHNNPNLEGEVIPDFDQPSSELADLRGSMSSSLSSMKRRRAESTAAEKERAAREDMMTWAEKVLAQVQAFLGEAEILGIIEVESSRDEEGDLPSSLGNSTLGKQPSYSSSFMDSESDNKSGYRTRSGSTSTTATTASNSSWVSKQVSAFSFPVPTSVPMSRSAAHPVFASRTAPPPSSFATAKTRFVSPSNSMRKVSLDSVKSMATAASFQSQQSESSQSSGYSSDESSLWSGVFGRTHHGLPRAGGVIYRLAPAVLGLSKSTNDHLLSTIAAFVGHVHAHSRQSHPQSFAYLIDLTREIIERVREVLCIVEGVEAWNGWRTGGENESSIMQFELDTLARRRETLYVTTTALVTAARAATASAPDDSSEEDPDLSGSSEEEEKSALLQSATTVLRAGGDCVTALKACIGSNELKKQMGESPASSLSETMLFQITLPLPSSAYSTPGPPSSRRLASASTPPTIGHVSHHGSEEDLIFEDTRNGLGLPGVDRLSNGLGVPARGSLGPARSKRGPHTLSFLGRKSTSLSCLREKYAHDAMEAEQSFRRGIERVEEDDEETLEGVPVYIEPPSPHPRSSTERGTPTPPPPLPLKSDIPAVATRPRGRTDPPQPRVPLAVNIAPPVPPKESPEPQNVVLQLDGQALSEQEQSIIYRPGPRRSSLIRPDSQDMSRPSSPVQPLSPTQNSPFLTPISPSASRFGFESSDASSLRSVSTSPTTPAGSSPSLLDRDYEAKEVAFNSSGQVIGGTLRCLVERLTLHDTPTDPNFSSTFFATFRLFTSPTELTEAMIARFDLRPNLEGQITPQAFQSWNESKAKPIRLRVYNFFKTWLELHYQHSTDDVVLQRIGQFARDRVASAMPGVAQRLIDLVTKRSVSGAFAGGSTEPQTGMSIPAHQTGSRLPRKASAEKLKASRNSVQSFSAGSGTESFGVPAPAPVVTRHFMSTLRSQNNISILELDPLELARQLTIMESRAYCSIKPEELLRQEFSQRKRDGTGAPNVRAMSSMSTRLTGLVSEIILDEQDAKRRTVLLKYFVKLGDRCLALNNYNALMAVVAALNSSTISRLKKTWEGLSPKTRATLEQLRKATEHTRNYAEYRRRLREAQPPCLPFLGLYLTDITFCHDGNPTHRPSPIEPELKLINFDRYHKMNRIVNDMQRFQVPYNLSEVPEIQSWLKSSLEGLRHGGDVGELYRRSLLVEPRQQSGEPSGYGGGQAGGAANHEGKGGRDLFNWSGKGNNNTHS